MINAMLYVRGNKKNYDDWAEAGCKGWSYDEVLPYFKKLENNTSPDIASDTSITFHCIFIIYSNTILNF